MDYLGRKIGQFGAGAFLVTSAAMQLIGGAMVVFFHPRLDIAVYTLLANVFLQVITQKIDKIFIEQPSTTSYSH
jgi:hypothetical protein